MSKEKKSSTDELYAKAQWSDNMRFSREAMHESKKKNTQALSPVDTPAPQQAITKNLTDPAPSKSPAKSTPRKTTNQLDQYVSEMNSEMSKVSDAVGNRLDSMGDRISEAFRQVFQPLGELITGLAESIFGGIRSVILGVTKAIVMEFTFVLRTISEKVLGASANPRKTPGHGTDHFENTVISPTPGTKPLGTAPLATNIPQYKMTFGPLLEQKVFFSTIHGRSFLSEKDVQSYDPDNLHQAHDWMGRALEEIRNCAPYGQNLPTPDKGPYMGIPMFDLLREINYKDLESFLVFVSNRPQPFQQKSLKLSEAYATWVHKGAPER